MRRNENPKMSGSYLLDCLKHTYNAIAISVNVILLHFEVIRKFIYFRKKTEGKIVHEASAGN